MKKEAQANRKSQISRNRKVKLNLTQQTEAVDKLFYPQQATSSNHSKKAKVVKKSDGTNASLLLTFLEEKNMSLPRLRRILNKR